MDSILFISEEEEAFRTFQSCLHPQYKIAKASDKNTALDVLQKKRYDFVFIDIDLLKASSEENNYKEALQPFWQLYPTVEVVVMCSLENLREAVNAVKAGASTYLTYPIEPTELKLVIKSIYDYKIMESELDYFREKFWQADVLDFIRTKSPAMQNVFEKIQAVAPTKSTVLLAGETGTGKGLLANLIHRHSNRRKNQFISVHCGAITETLIESELFGHEKGAFTGADRRKLGKFEISKGGTIFLDEIGTISPSAQIKLLQILQDQTFQRVGGEEVIIADVRIIAATNSDLEAMCEEGQFRRDLFYRLNVFPIEIPPLRERAEDIPHLVQVIVNKMSRTHDIEIHDIHPQVLEAFQKYPWPGNIRELENLIERACILERSNILTPKSFPEELFKPDVARASISIDASMNLAETRQRAVAEIERNYLEKILAANRGRINQSAQAAGITTRQLHKLMRKYELRKEDFKPST